MTQHIFINEVAARDGIQAIHTPINLAGKLALINACAAAGVQAIEACSFVSPKAVPQMADADELFAQLPDTDRIQYSALVPNLRGLERARAAAVQEIAVVLCATDTMNLRNIGLSLAQTIAMCIDTIHAAEQYGMRAKAYVSVAFECPYEGLVQASSVLDLCDRMIQAGASEIVIADTIGAANPRQVKDLIGECVKRYGAQRVSAHFHDTRGFALANVWSALEVGVRKFDTSIGGLGGCPFAPGAAGNVATEDVVLLTEQCGFSTGIDIAGLRQAIRVAEGLVGYPLGGRTRAWLDVQDKKQTGQKLS
ncbi:hydroxymethylglutaryl-CoA lyase [Alcaligenaceae bacterium CGII-47]|nr:hydroxymethylglutaryl-CoA lyase [Alcaligenaceae bacterium CGII-47]